MLSLQDMLDIAIRYPTRMADQMILACYERAYELGVRLRAPTRPRPNPPPERGARPRDGTDYERLVTSNTDTRRNHV